MTQDSAIRMRRPTIAAAPLFIVGLIGSSFALALILWGSWDSAQLGAAFWVPMIFSVLIGLGGFVGARGCFVEIDGDKVSDFVAWLRVQRFDRGDISDVNVRPGIWRWFELEMVDGRIRILLGASPAQFPARLLDSAKAQDEADIAEILGAGPTQA